MGGGRRGAGRGGQNGEKTVALFPEGRGYLPMVEAWRGDSVESIHFGALAVVDAAGGAVASLGDPGLVTFLRSSAQPFQVLPLLAAGAAERFGLTESDIAVMIGSHRREPVPLQHERCIL